MAEFRKYGDYPEAHDDSDIHLVRDSVRLTLEKMCRNAGVDIAQLMDYEPPSSSFLGRTHPSSADLHVEWLDDEPDEFDDQDYDLSMDDALAPNSFADESVPRQTKAPFQLHGQDVHIPGMFGSALAEYGKAVALYRSEGAPESDVTDYFKRNWQLTDESNGLLKASVPILRSEGDAKWAGVERNLVPACFAMPASSAKLRVKHHGLTRLKAGPGALIDWNRVDEIAKALAVRVMADDRHARGKTFRLDLAVDRKKFTEKPLKIDIKPIDFSEISVIRFSLDHRTIDEYLTKSRSANLVTSRDIAADTVIVSMPQTFTGMDILRVVKSMNAPRLNVPDMYNRHDVTEDLDYGKSAIITVDRRGDTMTADSLMEIYAERAVYQGVGKDIRAWHILGWISEAEGDEGDSPGKIPAELTKLIKHAFPDSFLRSASSFWAVAKGNTSADQRARLLANLVKVFRIPHGIMQDHNLVSWWVQARNMRHVAIKLAYILHKQKQKVEIMGRSRNAFVADPGDISNPEVPLNALFRQRKMDWVNRYVANSKSGNDMRVHYQLLAAMMRAVVVRVGDQANVTLEVDTICAALCKSAGNFVRKRKKLASANAPFFSYMDIRLGRLDKWVKESADLDPDPGYDEMILEGKKKAEEFCLDVREFVTHVMLGRESEFPIPSTADILSSRDTTNPERGKDRTQYETRPKKKHSAILSKYYDRHKQKIAVHQDIDENEFEDVEESDGWETISESDPIIATLRNIDEDSGGVEEMKEVMEFDLDVVEREDMGMGMGMDEELDDDFGGSIGTEEEQLLILELELYEDFGNVAEEILHEFMALHPDKVSFAEYAEISEAVQTRHKEWMLAQSTGNKSTPAYAVDPDLDVNFDDDLI